MKPQLENRAKLRRQPAASQEDLTIRVKIQNGSVIEAAAKVIDISEDGVGLELSRQLSVGILVEIASPVESTDIRQPFRRVARVRWCLAAANGRYRVGLSFEKSAEDFGRGQDASSNLEEDHYEVLQLSPNADAETIQRVFRILAQRYHPDNQETGNAGLFLKIKESYDVLMDPEKRAAYDVRRNTNRQDRIRIFSDWKSSSGMEAEKRKRQGILGLLYAQRVSNPHQPGVTIRELEDILACPREHLEFSLWFLKERKYITRSDNNRHAITCEGVEAAEHDELTVIRYGRPRLAGPAG